MNIALEQTEEHVNGVVTNRYGDAFIRGNNGAWLYSYVMRCVNLRRKQFCTFRLQKRYRHGFVFRHRKIGAVFALDRKNHNDRFSTSAVTDCVTLRYNTKVRDLRQQLDHCSFKLRLPRPSKVKPCRLLRICYTCSDLKDELPLCPSNPLYFNRPAMHLFGDDTSFRNR